MHQRSSESLIQSVRRAFDALDLLAEAAPHTLGVLEVAEQLQVAPATASRLLSTLVEKGYASKAAHRRFTVGPRSINLATRWIQRVQAGAAAPLARVHEATGENVFLSQLLGGSEVAVAWLGSRDLGQARIVVSKESPYIWATASGRALLAGATPAQRNRLLPPEPYPQLTDHTPTRWNDLRDSIRTGVKDGLFFEHAQASSELWCCAVPLQPGDSGELLAVSVVCLGEPTRSRRAQIHNIMAKEAHNLYLSLTEAG